MLVFFLMNKHLFSVLPPGASPLNRWEDGPVFRKVMVFLILHQRARNAAAAAACRSFSTHCIVCLQVRGAHSGDLGDVLLGDQNEVGHNLVF